MMTEAAGPPPKRFTVTTTAQVERVYVVVAKDSEQAHARVRAFLTDPEMIGSGVVEEQVDQRKNTSPEQVQKGKIESFPPKAPAKAEPPTQAKK